MQSIEFETIAHHHSIRIPESVPDGVRLRVRLVVEPGSENPVTGDLKALLAGLAEGLTDEDLRRPRDTGRELPEWDT